MGEHYYSENPESEIKERYFKQTLNSMTLEFSSVSGVFSFGTRIDKASELLIENFKPSGNTVLDMGCGYGAIGLFIKAQFPKLSVTMTDINNRAVEFTAANALKNRLEVSVTNGDLYSGLSGQVFDDIVSNPPIAAGKKLNTQLIEQAKLYLNKEGALWLVAFHNKGGETLKGIMKNVFGNVTDVEKSGGIRVYKAVAK